MQMTAKPHFGGRPSRNRDGRGKKAKTPIQQRFFSICKRKPLSGVQTPEGQVKFKQNSPSCTTFLVATATACSSGSTCLGFGRRSFSLFLPLIFEAKQVVDFKMRLARSKMNC
ncbi:hypothetical protein TNIN_100081 [Trichonephila inaurata madagascariensis]|uniref:Uncharacterized protein n=1 Tax=Trichonephila inaurata madagascariensis TaxID=2747483 RepID=A0A8X7CTY6_9ARAC|nr:hypothetical protein TNIN_100081 [Trichonephila inaurata madagascariensis]